MFTDTLHVLHLLRPRSGRAVPPNLHLGQLDVARGGAAAGGGNKVGVGFPVYPCENPAAFAWASKRQACIAMSSTEAEMMALAEAANELEYIIQVFTHVGHEFDSGIDLEFKKDE